MARICAQCGVSNIESSTFCRGCGISFSKPAIKPSRAIQPYRAHPGPRVPRPPAYSARARYPSFYPQWPTRPNLYKIFMAVFLAGLIVTSFGLLVSFYTRPPSITHTPAESTLAGTPINLNATVISGGLGTHNVTVYYKSEKIDTIKNVSMELVDNHQPYLANISANDVDSTVVYSIEAIGGFDSKTYTPIYIVEVRDFNVTLANEELEVRVGESETVSLTVWSASNFNSQVSLSLTGAPSGVTHSFSPDSVTPPQNGSTGSTLTISTSSTASPGTYSLSIVGTYGNLSHSDTLSLTINPEKDFSISANPTSNSVDRGDTAAYNLTITSLNGFDDSVTITLSGVPSKSTVRLMVHDNKTNFGGTQEIDLQIKTSRTQFGSYTITVTATGGGKTRTIDLELKILF